MLHPNNDQSLPCILTAAFRELILVENRLPAFLNNFKRDQVFSSIYGMKFD
jgi:hypothetical protein